MAECLLDETTRTAMQSTLVATTLVPRVFVVWARRTNQILVGSIPRVTHPLID